MNASLDPLALLDRLYTLLVPHVKTCHSLAQLYFWLHVFRETHRTDGNWQSLISKSLLEQVVTYFECALCVSLGRTAM